MFTFNCKGRLLIIDKPVVMGIINMDPESFYSGSKALSAADCAAKAGQMLTDGATIIDIGAQSTKPGSSTIGVQAELDRVIPAIELISERFPESFISIDTYHSDVAKAAVHAGASIVNDISAGTLDSNMIATVAQLNVPYIAMHIKGNPANMQELNNYDDMLLEILEFFIEKVNECTKAGIKDVIIDPGFGFAKNIDQNFTLLKNLHIFKILQKALLVGLSRKSTVYKTLKTTAEEALNGTTVLNTIALQNGAAILRVHDVKAAMETINLVEKYNS